MVGGGRWIECRVHGMAPYSAHDTTSLKGCNGTAHGKCKAIITRFRARSIGLADIYTPYPAIITALVPRNAVTLRFIERYFAWRWMCTRATQATRVYIYIHIYIVYRHSTTISTLSILLSARGKAQPGRLHRSDKMDHGGIGTIIRWLGPEKFLRASILESDQDES